MMQGARAYSSVCVSLCHLTGAGTENAGDRNVGEELTLGQPARNVAAFEVLRDVLIESTPILSQLLRRVSILVAHCDFVLSAISRLTCRIVDLFFIQTERR